MMCRDLLVAKKSGKYENLYCNVRVKIPGVTFIDNECIGQYDLRNAFIAIDEATLFADSRDFKTFGKDKIFFFLNIGIIRSISAYIPSSGTALTVRFV